MDLMEAMPRCPVRYADLAGSIIGTKVTGQLLIPGLLWCTPQSRRTLTMLRGETCLADQKAVSAMSGSVRVSATDAKGAPRLCGVWQLVSFMAGFPG